MTHTLTIRAEGGWYLSAKTCPASQDWDQSRLIEAFEAAGIKTYTIELTRL